MTRQRVPVLPASVSTALTALGLVLALAASHLTDRNQRSMAVVTFCHEVEVGDYLDCRAWASDALQHGLVTVEDLATAGEGDDEVEGSKP